jgi:shikimate 5-dehydrogenase
VHSFLSVITGSFSVPARDNPTVAMIEAGYRHHGVDARYLNCEVAPEALGDAVRGARAMGWVGFNCSMPHKVAVIAGSPFCSVTAPATKLYAGARGPVAQVVRAADS